VRTRHWLFCWIIEEKSVESVVDEVFEKKRENGSGGDWRKREEQS